VSSKIQLLILPPGTPFAAAVVIPKEVSVMVAFVTAIGAITSGKLIVVVSPVTLVENPSPPFIANVSLFTIS